MALIDELRLWLIENQGSIYVALAVWAYLMLLRWVFADPKDDE